MARRAKRNFCNSASCSAPRGSTAASEHLLRRNLTYYDGAGLYMRLFGTAGQEEYEAAIEAFKAQFDLKLAMVAENDFLVSAFRSGGGRVWELADPMAE